MRKLILVLLTLLTFGVHGQDIPELKTIPSELVGVWKNFDNEFLIITLSGEFQRIDVDGKRLAIGTIDVDKDTIKVRRNDINDSYSLGYLVNEQTFVVSKPRNNQRAWLFLKVN